MKFEAELDGRVVPIEVAGEAGRYRVSLEGEALDVDARRVGEGLWSLVIGSASIVAEVTEEDGVSVVHVDGETYRIRVEEETRYLIRTRGAAAAAAGQVLKAPMPGRVVLIEVTVGQRVQRGDGLVILEAMKMENEFRASGEGTVKEIRVQAGQAVNPGDILMVIE
jgi:biotin carboxyl carrier protein